MSSFSASSHAEAAKAVYQGRVAAESMQRYMEGKDLEEGRTLSCYMVTW